MSKKIIERIHKEANTADLLPLLTAMPSSDLTSLLMEVMRRKTEQLSPGDLFRNYTSNRFVKPADVDFVSFSAFQLGLLQKAQSVGFSPLELSPVSPLGSCAAVATVNQDKILSALRSTEVVADATNLLALEAVTRRKQTFFDQNTIRLCTVHRHLRTPYVKLPFTAHFKIFCMVTAGKDTGSLLFEKQHLVEHIRFITDFLKSFPAVEAVKVVLKSTQKENTSFASLRDTVMEEIKDVMFVKEEVEQPYYQIIQFKVFVTIAQKEVEIADGGFVDWSQKLSNNRKERMLTSGIGIELLFKLLDLESL
ncbi:hypothetical protein [Runella sp.]|uniref:hypothetical protein n=1 Tax=Runella sp. TaxID=1960881 RepID=UPI003D0FFFB6